MKNTTRKELLKTKKICLMAKIGALGAYLGSIVTICFSATTDTPTESIKTMGIGLAIGCIGWVVEKVSNAVEKQTDQKILFQELYEIDSL